MTRWEGYEVRLDGPTVRFGSGEHDWISPTGDPDRRPTDPLRSAFVSRDGCLLTVCSDDFNFTFYAAQDDDYGGTVFHYRCRPRTTLGRVRDMLER